MQHSLLFAVRTFLREFNMPETLFGRLSVRDPRLVHDMKRGRQPGERMQARVTAFMTDYRMAQAAVNPSMPTTPTQSAMPNCATNKAD